MAKQLKLNIKNTQIAEAIKLGGLKGKLAEKLAPKTEETTTEKSEELSKARKSDVVEDQSKEIKEEAPRKRARSRSAFEPSATEQQQPVESAPQQPELNAQTLASTSLPNIEEAKVEAPKAEKAELSFLEEAEQLAAKKGRGKIIKKEEDPVENLLKQELPKVVEPVIIPKLETPPAPAPAHAPKEFSTPPPLPQKSFRKEDTHTPLKDMPHKAHDKPHAAPYVKLGPTGQHIRDLLPHRYPPKKPPEAVAAETRDVKAAPKQAPQVFSIAEAEEKSKLAKNKGKPKPREFGDTDEARKGLKTAKVKEFRDIKPIRRQDTVRTFDARDKQGLRASDDDQQWRKRRAAKQPRQQEDITVRPTQLSVRVPITIKDLASEMKLKSSQLIAKMFLQGIVVTLNDFLDDETTIQLLGHEFGCELTIDTSEEKRIQITDKNIKEEIQSISSEDSVIRAPVVAFMGHVDHGKTSLIDAIRKTNRASGEAGAITQHIGAFCCKTDSGEITILDTPGHEAFSAMRARGADVTDIVVLVVAGDEGIRQQTIEAIQHAKAAKVTIVVAINKSDKPGFNPENVYRQLAEQELLPETWGGQTITINCSAVSGEGIIALLEMLALQAEVLELRANPNARARGRVIESEMHKGLGSVATVLVQNGTLRLGDAIVFAHQWGRVKTMQDEFGHDVKSAGPSTPVAVTGLSGLPRAGEEFIVVKNEREACEIAEARMLGLRQTNLQQKKTVSAENLIQQHADSVKKYLNVILRADVQGSLEALKTALMKIDSAKVEPNIIFAGVGEVSESDVQLATASKAVIFGFHTQIESHAEALVRQLGVQVRLHDIIYHAVDDVKVLMGGLLDKIAQENDKGKAEVKATFKSSHVGTIAGCQVIEGSIHRNNHMRVIRAGTAIWKGSIQSLKRIKEDVREIQKGHECGILLNGFTDFQVGDILEAYEVTYLTQEL